MSDDQPSPFAYRTVHRGDRVLIESTCTRCGESRIVSHCDRSLEKWEEEHACGSDERGVHLAPAS